jgi:ketosteroid isomerase-like protein
MTSAPENATEATRAAVLGWLRGIEAGLPGTELAGYLDDEVTWTLMGSLPRSQTYDGKDAVLAFFGTVAGSFRPGSITREVQNVIVDGDYAAVEIKRGGVTAAGAAYRNDHVLVIRVKDGKFAAVREYIDTLAASAVE